MNKDYVKKIPKNYSFSKNGFSMKLLESIDEKVSIGIVETQKGRDNFCLCDISTMYYYVIEGSGYFIIEDQKYKVEKDNIVEIPSKHKYTYKGNLKMFEIMNPCFDEKMVHEI